MRLRTSIVGLTLIASTVSIGTVVVVGNAIAASQTMAATTDVNLRSGPGTSYSILTVVPDGALVTAVSTSDGWTKVNYDGRTGYVSSTYLAPSGSASTDGGSTAGTGTATTNTSVNVRTGPSTSYPVVALLQAGVTLRTTGVTSGAWTQVIYDGVNRWMYSAYLTPGSGSGGAAETSQVRTTENLNMRTEGYLGATIVGVLPKDSIVDVTGETTDTYTQIVYQGQKVWISNKYIVPLGSGPVQLGSTTTMTAKQKVLVDFVNAQVGKAYVWAAEGPDAYDCSGLTMMAYKQIGMSIPHYSGAQATLGTAVSRSDLKPGDLIFWFSPISHVSMYVGNGMMVHARNVKVGVVKQSVQSYIDGGAYYNRARRLLNS